MTDIKRLESEYLRAKIEYYAGTPIMSDSAFDVLEQKLKDLGSKVHEQVGSKRKDFDFEHPTKMLSLAKIQTEIKNGITNYQEAEFKNWVSKRSNVIPKDTTFLCSPKFDGNAINIVYKGKNLSEVLTRGDGTFGKNVTRRFLSALGTELTLSNLDVSLEDTIEIRCEVVIKKSIFEDKYADDYANPRNYVAGVIGKDDYDVTKVSELTIIPLQFLLNGEFIPWEHFKNTPFCAKNWDQTFVADNYTEVIKGYERIRDRAKYLLDGVVIATPIQYRKELGENSHDPEWALAIKFVPEQVVTTVTGIEWNVGKRGQLTPVVLMEGVQLAGTTVKRASGYNAGYIQKNGIGPGAMVAIAKAGDIIPEIQSVELPVTNVSLPVTCHDCGSALQFDGTHLECINDGCAGRIAKKLSTGATILGLKNVGGERLRPFASECANMYEVWIHVLTHDDLSEFGLNDGTRLKEIFVDAFKNIKSLPYEKVIQLLGYDNVGKKITKQLAREHAGLSYDYASLEKALVEKMHLPEVEMNIKDCVETLEYLGVVIDRPAPPNQGVVSLGVVLTGSPKGFGYKTKGEFLAKFPNLVECSLSDSNCKYLITDDMNSTSSKMKTATKKGIEIKTYGDFK